MQGFNWVDYSILGVFLLSVLVGLSRGIIKEVMSLLSWVAAFVVASLFAPALASHFTGSQQVQNVISSATTNFGNMPQQVSWLAVAGSFVAIFVVTLIIGAIISKIISGAVESGGISIVNRLLGGVFGGLRGFLINLLIIFVVQLVPQVPQQSWWTSSVMVNAFQPAVQWLGSIMQPSIEAIKSKVSDSLQGVGSTITQGINSVTSGGGS